jgi:hypothetical protein
MSYRQKKTTRYCCPVCGKNNWNESECSEHSQTWQDLLDTEYEARQKSRADGEAHWHDSITGYKDDQFTIFDQSKSGLSEKGGNEKNNY